MPILNKQHTFQKRNVDLDDNDISTDKSFLFLLLFLLWVLITSIELPKSKSVLGGGDGGWRGRGVPKAGVITAV